jgi:hypothetical protein
MLLGVVKLRFVYPSTLPGETIQRIFVQHASLYRANLSFHAPVQMQSARARFQLRNIGVECAYARGFWLLIHLTILV